MFQKIGIRLLAASMALLAGASVGSAQVKVAIVDVQRAVFESAEIKKASAAMEAKYKPRQAEIDRLEAEALLVSVTGEREIEKILRAARDRSGARRAGGSSVGHTRPTPHCALPAPRSRRTRGSVPPAVP